MNGVFYDTETTGLPNRYKNDDHESQPHIVQLAAIVCDLDDRETFVSMDRIVRPDGWVIPDEVAAIHGITTERAMDEGIAEKVVLDEFMALHEMVAIRIAHNEAFDAKILRIALMRYHGMIAVQKWRCAPAECTSDMSEPILDLPPSERMIKAGITGPKKPRLEEAYKYFTGNELQGAHDAMNDVLGCMAVYWAVKDLPAPI